MSKRIISAIMCFALAIGCMNILSGCNKTEKSDENAETVVFTDSCGREVTIPKNITRVAPSGSTSQMILYTIDPSLLVGVSSTPDTNQMKYLDKSMMTLPSFGQFYGSKASLNMESLIAANPQVIIDLGDKKENHSEDMDNIEEQTGIPTIFIEANLDTFSSAYRTLGKLLNREEQCESIASYIDEKISFAKDCSAKINENDRVSIAFATGTTGLDCNARGSVQADIIELIGAKNAIVVDEVISKNGGNTINMEQMYNFDPEVIIFDAAGGYDLALSDERFAKLEAVKNNRFYEIPSLPFNWMSNPPSVNRILGISWLGKLIYPDLYEIDINAEVKRFYKLFWHYDISDEEINQFLLRSIYK